MSTPTMKELIEKATPGPRLVSPHYISKQESLALLKLCVYHPEKFPDVARFLDDSPRSDANAQLIARCNPATMAKVVEALEGLVTAYYEGKVTLPGRVLVDCETTLNLLNGKPTQ